MERNRVLGILAHVDAGKTTLSESILLKSGSIRKAGRVDHRDTFLDTDVQERQRGITIYAKPAMFEWNGIPFTAIDTPGHTDLASETERALSVLDAAVLLISAPDGIQGHTRTLWKLLETYRVPVFLFFNKMDMPGADKKSLMKAVREQLSCRCAEAGTPEFLENAAENSEEALETYLDSGLVTDETVTAAVCSRQLFPCLFGSALHHEGVEELLNAVSRFTRPCQDNGELCGRVFKVSRDARGERLAFIKITGGALHVRAPILTGTSLNAETEEQKVSSIRLYSGEKYTQVDSIPAGSVAAVTGLKNVVAGDFIGADGGTVKSVLDPVFSYRVILPAEADVHTVLGYFKQLEEEDPMLKVGFSAAHKEITVRVMGNVALEILARVMKDRFGLEVAFDSGSIVYRETVAQSVCGMGHYEPLRHYAEVHIRIDPAVRGSGVRVRSEVSTDDLELSWQRLIFTHLLEKKHTGVLTGSPLTDVTFTLTAGRAHLKHTEGGDFRQATYRAVRQGLMNAECILLEPWYRMQLTLPQDCAGRAMTDITRMGGSFEAPANTEDEVIITAAVPVRTCAGYQRELQSYSRGLGRMTLEVSGYEPCPDQEEIVRQIGYDPERDTDNPAGSVFCSHGAGTLVDWREAPAWMHLHPEQPERPGDDRTGPSGQRSSRSATDAELMAIFERTYGKQEQKLNDNRAVQPRRELPKVSVIDIPKRPEYLLVDGYNIIFSWPELKSRSIESARRLLTDILDNYAAHRDLRLILVFDAYKVERNPGHTENYGNIRIVYTKEAQTADSYIEKLAYELSDLNRVRVATSDGLEQLIILGGGALRMSASELRREIEQSDEEIRRILERYNDGRAGQNIGSAMRKAQGGKTE